PSTTCQSGTKASVQLRHDPNFFRNSLKFSWKGGPVLLGDLGDPLETTRYELCLYDSTGVKMAVGVPPGSGWWIIGSPAHLRGYRYKDKTAAHDGVKEIKLQGSSIGKALLKLTAQGPYLPQTPPPFDLPVTAQLHAADGSCWDATFTAAETRSNTPKYFYGSAPPR